MRSSAAAAPLKRPWASGLQACSCTPSAWQCCEVQAQGRAAPLWPSLKLASWARQSSLPKLISSWLATRGWSSACSQRIWLACIFDAEVAHLAAFLQLAECHGDFFGLHQGVGSVQQQQVQLLGAQAFQAALHRGDDVLGRGGHNARARVAWVELGCGIALQNDPIAQRRLAAQQGAEAALGPAC